MAKEDNIVPRRARDRNGQKARNIGREGLCIRPQRLQPMCCKDLPWRQGIQETHQLSKVLVVRGAAERRITPIGIHRDAVIDDQACQFIRDHFEPIDQIRTARQSDHQIVVHLARLAALNTRCNVDLLHKLIGKELRKKLDCGAPLKIDMARCFMVAGEQPPQLAILDDGHGH